MFLLAVCGPEDAGWELLEERVSSVLHALLLLVAA